VLTLKGYKRRPRSCRPPVLMDEAAQYVATTERACPGVSMYGPWPGNWGGQSETPMRSLLAVVLDVCPQDALKVPTPEDEDVIQTLGANGAHEPLGEGVGSRCPDGRSDHPDALAMEHSSNGPENFASRSRTRNPTSPSRSPIARFLACWVTQAESGCAVTPARCTRRVDSSMRNKTRLERHRLDGEEVAREDALGL